MKNLKRIKMREFELLIDQALKNGLSPEEMVPFNTQILAECIGFRCGRLGLQAAELGENRLPSALNILYSWPFPQFIAEKTYNILVVRDAITNLEDKVYQVSNDLETVTHIFDIDQLTFGIGELMEVADFGKYAFMTNGVIMIYWDPTITDWMEIVASATIPMMKTVCNFKGVAVGGNVVSAWPVAEPQCDETYYVWSKVGEIDFTPDAQNESGYRRCPYGGEVYHVRRLGDNVIGYSSKGITLLSPVSAPVTTFGFVELDDVGLINKGAIDGNLMRQVYVDAGHMIKEVTKEGVKNLGYSQHMKELAGEDIIVTYDKSKGDFYIGNSTKTYLLSPNGLTEVLQHPSATWRAFEDSDHICMLPEVVDTTKPLISTEVFDFQYKGQKTIATIETDAMICEGEAAAVDWANDLTTWGFGSFVPLNDMGIASITASGNMFRFRLRFDSIYEGFRISYMKARYKMTDLRGIRGVYAPGIRGQKGD